MCQNPLRGLDALSLSHTTASRTTHTSAPRCTLSAATAKSSGHRLLLAAAVGWRWRSHRFLLATAPTMSSPPPSSDLAGPRAWSHPYHSRGGNLLFVLLTAPPLLPVTTSSSPPHSSSPPPLPHIEEAAKPQAFAEEEPAASERPP